jgi:hypothetical protein
MPERTFNADILGRLTAATPEELRAALSAIRADFAAYQGQPATAESLEAVRELRGAAEQISGELGARPAREAEQAAALEDLSRFTELTEEPAEGADGDGGAQDGADEGAGDGAEETEGEGAEEGGEGHTASAGRPRRRIGSPVANRSDRRAAARRPGTVKLRTTAAAGLRDYSPGQDMDREALYRAFAQQIQAMDGTPGNQRYTVATVRSEYPANRHLMAHNSPFANMQMVEAAVDDARSRHARANAQDLVVVRSGPEGVNAITAAGLCAPLETLYDIRVVGDTDRPVRDALVRFGADRGGIQYRPAMNGVAQTGGIGTWTATNDTADPLVPKTCVEIACPGVVTAQVQAIYKCLTFSNMSTRFDPEFYDAVIRSQDIAHARTAENQLLTQLTTASKDVYSTQILGATRDTLTTMDHMVAYYRSVHRLADETPLRWIAPLWHKYMMRADITRQMVGDGLQSLAVTDDQLNQWLAERNINVTWHLDGIDPADLTAPTPDIVVPAQFYTVLADEVAVPGFPDAVSTLLFAEGDWLFLDGGTLDLGVVRDSTLNGTNRFQTFSESWEFSAFRGIESIHLVLQVQPNGASAATVQTATSPNLITD